MNNFAIIIPARLSSSRLPNKPLAIINNKTMIERVCQRANMSKIQDIYVACDSRDIYEIVENKGYKAILTDSDLPSGTDRIYQAYQKINKEYDYIINLQGDLPNIDPTIIDIASNCAMKNDCDITTLAYKITDEKEISDKNIVKIAIAFKNESEGKALYFSRCPIPYSAKSDCYYHHIGIYVYRAQSLKNFIELRPSQLENRESLEQLRALENNMSIYVKIINSRPVSVDTKQDLELVTKIIKNEES